MNNLNPHWVSFSPFTPATRTNALNPHISRFRKSDLCNQKEIMLQAVLDYWSHLVDVRCFVPPPQLAALNERVTQSPPHRHCSLSMLSPDVLDLRILLLHRHQQKVFDVLVQKERPKTRNINTFPLHSQRNSSTIIGSENPHQSYCTPFSTILFQCQYSNEFGTMLL